MKKKIDTKRLGQAFRRVGAASFCVAATLSVPLAAQAATLPPQSDATLIAHGAYLARAGDCIANPSRAA